MHRVLLTAILLAGLLAPARGAPVPPPPKLTAELIGGATWRMEWGAVWKGVAVFAADGSYYAACDEFGGPCYLGTWRVEGGQLVLVEHVFRPETGYVSAVPNTYRIPLTTADYPRLVGSCGGTKVVFADPRR